MLLSAEVVANVTFELFMLIAIWNLGVSPFFSGIDYVSMTKPSQHEVQESHNGDLILFVATE